MGEIADYYMDEELNANIAMAEMHNNGTCYLLSHCDFCEQEKDK